MPSLEFLNRVKDSLFSIRFIAVSLLNYSAGYLIFTFLWLLTSHLLTYWQVACISTFLASIFSFQTQNRLILRRKNFMAIVNLRYITLQVTGLLLGIALVPFVGTYFSLSILFVQFIWSAFFSILAFLTLFCKRASYKVI